MKRGKYKKKKSSYNYYDLFSSLCNKNMIAIKSFVWSSITGKKMSLSSSCSPFSAGPNQRTDNSGWWQKCTKIIQEYTKQHNTSSRWHTHTAYSEFTHAISSTCVCVCVCVCAYTQANNALGTNEPTGHYSAIYSLCWCYVVQQQQYW